MCTFKCSKCSSDQIKFRKFVTITEDVVIHHDGHIQYRNPITDESDELGTGSKYICGNCKKPILLYGDYITNEFQLKKYINLSKRQIAEMQAEYVR